MKSKIFLSLIILLFSKMVLCQSHYKIVIKLKQKCFWEDKGRKIDDTLINKIAFVSREKGYYILTIDNRKYLPCNLPDKLKSKKIFINGIVYQGLSYEKLIATPLKITKASY